MKKFIVLFLLTIIFICPVFSSEITDDYYDIAKNYVNDNNGKKANEYIELILLLDPKNEKAQEFINFLTPIKKNINKDRIVKIEEAPLKDKKNNDSAYYNNEGVDAYDSENIKLAIVKFRRSIRSSFSNYIAYRNLALCYKKQGKIRKAQYYFKLSIFFNPVFSQAYIDLANIKDGNEKIKYLNKAISLNDKTACYYFAKYYQEIQNYLLSSKYYNDVLINNSDVADAYWQLGECYYELENYDAAITTLKQYITYDASNDRVYYLLAKSYLHLGYTMQAIVELKNAISINRNTDYMFQLAKICYLEHDYNLSIYVLNTLVNKNAKASYYNQLGLAYFELTNINSAIDKFKKALELDSSSATIYFNLSRCYRIYGDEKMANECIEKAKRIEPKNAVQYADLAILYYKLTEFDNALQTINDALKIYPNDKKLYKVKLRLCKLTGNFHEYEKTKTDLLMKFGVR